MHEGTSTSLVSKHIDLQHEPGRWGKPQATVSQRIYLYSITINVWSLHYSLYLLRVPPKPSQRLNFTTFVHSRPIAFMNKPLHPFWLHASVGSRFKMRWSSVLLAQAMCFKGGVTRCVHSFLFMCIIFQPWIFFSFFFSIIVECRWHAWKISSQQQLKHASILKVYRKKQNKKQKNLFEHIDLFCWLNRNKEEKHLNNKGRLEKKRWHLFCFLGQKVLLLGRSRIWKHNEN